MCSTEKALISKGTAFQLSKTFNKLIELNRILKIDTGDRIYLRVLPIYGWMMMTTKNE